MKKNDSNLNTNESDFHLTKRFFDYSNEMLCVAGFDGYFKLLNLAWSKTLGWSSEELLSKPWNEFVHPDDILDTENIKSSIVDGKEVYQFENRYRCKNGDYKWLSWNSYPHPEDEIMYGVARDITDSKKAEENLSKTLEKFNLLDSHLDGALYQYRLAPDGTSHFPYISSGVEKIYGVSPLQIQENPNFIFDRIHPDDSERIFDSIQSSANTLEKWHEEYRAIKQMGQILWIEGNATPQKLDDGSILWHGFFLDITVRKSTEKKIKFLHQLIAYMGEIAHVGGWEFDPLTGAGSWTDETYRIHDMNPGDKTSSELGLSFYKPESRRLIEKAIDEAINLHKSYRLELQLVTAKGVEKWVETIGNPIIENGKLINIRGSFQDITKRKNDEELLRLSEKKLKHSHHLLKYIVEHIGGSVAVHDKDLNYVYVSQRYLDFYNVTEKEILGKHHYDVFPDIPQKWKDVHQSALKGTVHKEDEDVFVRADGTVHWSRWECRPWYEMNGEVGGIIIYSEVITDQKMAEVELKKLSTAIEQSPNSIVITDVNGIIEYVNPAFENLTGYKINEAIGQSPNILNSGEQSAEFYEQLWSTISSGKTWVGEFLNKKKNGELYWESANISPVFDDHGNIMNYLVIKENITQRKADEEIIKQSELYHRSLLRSIPDLVFVLDDNGIFLDYKVSNEEGLLLTSAAFLNKNIQALMPVDVSNRVMSAVHECLDKVMNVNFEYSLKINDRIQFYNANMVAFGENKVIATVRNITEFKNNVIKIQSLLDIEEKQNESLRTFTRIVSHNLRIHSANMLGILMLLEMEDSETYENQFVQLIKESTENLEETIGHLNEVLEVKLIREKTFEKINLYNAVNKAKTSMKLFSDSNNVNLINDVAKEFFVDAVPSYLNSIIFNLINNGIRFSDNSKDSYVRISSEATDEKNVIIISDNGLGIDLELYGEELFDMYKKFHSPSNSKGLGLFIVKNQVESMGGHIEVESELTKGTTFKVYLPNEEKRDKRNMHH